MIYLIKPVLLYYDFDIYRASQKKHTFFTMLHSMKTCRNHCTPLSQGKIRISLLNQGTNLPVSIRRLCETVRKRVIWILSMSNISILCTVSQSRHQLENVYDHPDNHNLFEAVWSIKQGAKSFSNIEEYFEYVFSYLFKLSKLWEIL